MEQLNTGDLDWSSSCFEHTQIRHKFDSSRSTCRLALWVTVLLHHNFNALLLIVKIIHRPPLKLVSIWGRARLSQGWKMATLICEYSTSNCDPGHPDDMTTGWLKIDRKDSKFTVCFCWCWYALFSKRHIRIFWISLEITKRGYIVYLNLYKWSLIPSHLHSLLHCNSSPRGLPLRSTWIVLTHLKTKIASETSPFDFETCLPSASKTKVKLANTLKKLIQN